MSYINAIILLIYKFQPLHQYDHDEIQLFHLLLKESYLLILHVVVLIINCVILEFLILDPFLIINCLHLLIKLHLLAYTYFIDSMCYSKNVA